MSLSLAQRLAVARMKYSTSSGFRPNSVTKGLFNRIKMKTAANRIGGWFKRNYNPRRAVALNNARMKEEFDRFKFSAKHKASVRRHYATYSRMGKAAPPSRVKNMYVAYGWYDKPLYLK